MLAWVRPGLTAFVVLFRIVHRQINLHASCLHDFQIMELLHIAFNQ